MNTTKTHPIRPDATLLIQQPCASCNGTGETSEGALCLACYGTRRVTVHVTLAELAQAIGDLTAQRVRMATSARVTP